MILRRGEIIMVFILSSVPAGLPIPVLPAEPMGTQDPKEWKLRI